MRRSDFLCVSCKDVNLAEGILYCEACLDPAVKKAARSSARKREKEAWVIKNPKKRRYKFPFDVPTTSVVLVRSTAWHGRWAAHWDQSVLGAHAVPVVGAGLKAQGNTARAARRALLKLTEKKFNVRLTVNPALDPKDETKPEMQAWYVEHLKKEKKRMAKAEKKAAKMTDQFEAAKAKLNTKSKKGDLLAFLVKNGGSEDELSKLTVPVLLKLVKSSEMLVLVEKAPKKAPKKKKAKKTKTKKTKAEPKAKKEKKKRKRRGRNADLPKGKRNTGLIKEFRALWKGKKKMTRDDILKPALEKHGRRARSCMRNYIAKALKGELKDFPKLVEKNGVLTKKGK